MRGFKCLLTGSLIPIEGSLHRIGAEQQSTKVNSSLIKYLNSLNVGAIDDISVRYHQ